MKKIMWSMVVMLMAGMLTYQTSVWAEMLQGTVSMVDSSAGYLSMKHTDNAGKSQEMKISVPSNAELKGIHNLADLKAGDEVKVDASKAFLFFGPWQAHAVEATLSSGKAAPKAGSEQKAEPEAATPAEGQ